MPHSHTPSSSMSSGSSLGPKRLYDRPRLPPQQIQEGTQHHFSQPRKAAPSKPPMLPVRAIAPIAHAEPIHAQPVHPTPNPQPSQPVERAPSTPKPPRACKGAPTGNNAGAACLQVQRVQNGPIVCHFCARVLYF